MGELIEGTDPPHVDQARIDAFWANARIRANLNRMSVISGPSVVDTVPPPVWSFGTTAEADRLLELVLAGTKTAVSEPLQDLTSRGDPLPERGDLSILLDSTGAPRALLRTAAVTVVPFHSVDEGHVRAEAEGDGTVEWWARSNRVRFLGPQGDDVSAVPDDAPVVCERFDVLVPTRTERRRLLG